MAGDVTALPKCIVAIILPIVAPHKIFGFVDQLIKIGQRCVLEEKLVTIFGGVIKRIPFLRAGRRIPRAKQFGEGRIPFWEMERRRRAG